MFNQSVYSATYNMDKYFFIVFWWGGGYFKSLAVKFSNCVEKQLH